MICSMCSEKYNEGERFCKYCGNQLKTKQKNQGFEPGALIYGPPPVYDNVPPFPDEEELIKIKKLKFPTSVSRNKWAFSYWFQALKNLLC